MTLRNSANVTDAYLERKLRYEYAKLKPKASCGQDRCAMRLCHSTKKSAEDTYEATSSRQDLEVSSFIPTTTGKKRQESSADPERDV